MRVYSGYRESLRAARELAPGGQKNHLAAIFQQLRRQGITLVGRHDMDHHTHSPFLGDLIGWGNSTFHSLIARLSRGDITPHYDQTMAIAWKIVEAFEGIELAEGSYNLGNLIVHLAGVIRRENLGWGEPQIERVVQRELPKIINQPDFFNPPGTPAPKDYLTAEEKQLEINRRRDAKRAMLSGASEVAEELINRTIETGQPISELEAERLLGYYVDGRALTKILLLMRAQPQESLRPLLRKAWLSLTAGGLNLADDWGYRTDLLSEDSNERIDDNVRSSADSSDDPIQPWLTPGVNIREEAMTTAFGRNLSRVYLEAHLLSKELCHPEQPAGGLSTRELAGDWAPGTIIDTTSVAGFFRDSVHNGPNKGDTDFLRAVVHYWTTGSAEELDKLERRGRRPLGVWIESPQEVSPGDRVMAASLLKAMEAQYEFAANLVETDFMMFPADAGAVMARYRQADALEKLSILTEAREKLYRILTGMPETLTELTRQSRLFFRTGGIDPNALIIAEHKMSEATQVFASEVMGEYFAEINRTNLASSIDFLNNLVTHLRCCGFEVEPLIGILTEYRKLVAEAIPYYQGLYTVHQRFMQQVAETIDIYQQEFGRLRELMLSTGEWDKGGEEGNAAYRHVMDGLLRGGLFSQLSVVAERINGFLQGELAAEPNGIEAGRLSLPEIEEILELREAFPGRVARDQRYYHLGSGGDPLPDSLNGRLELGNKGFNLALLAQHGLPVPPALVMTASQVRAFPGDRVLLAGELARTLPDEVTWLQMRTRQTFGLAGEPLLVSVRPSAPLVIPGAMETILNVGLNREIAENLASLHGRAFAYSTYLNFILSFGSAALGLPERAVEALRSQGVSRLTGEQQDDFFFKALVERVQEVTRQEIPMEPWQQLAQSVIGVKGSYNTAVAAEFRNLYGLPEEWAMAIMIQQMVFGNRQTVGARSGSFSVASHDPITGSLKAAGLTGDVAWGQQGSAVMSALVNVGDAAEFAPVLEPLVRRGEAIRRGAVEMEITVQAGRPYVLQTKTAVLSPEATLHAQIDLVNREIITKAEALKEVKAVWAQLTTPRFAANSKPIPVAKGVPASAGAAVGRIVIPANLEELMASPADAIVIAPYLDPGAGEKALQGVRGVLTARGGVNSHAANVARKIGLPCVAGCAEMVIDYASKAVRIGGQDFKEGDVVSLDGSTGEIMVGEVPLVPSRLVEILSTGRVPDLFEDPDGHGIYEDYLIIKEWASSERVFLPDLHQLVEV